VREEREILPLPERTVFSENPMEFVDTLIDTYEVKHFNTFDTEFELRNIEVTETDDGYIFTGQISARYNTGAISLFRPINEYFTMPKDNFAILTRFKSDAVKYLRFGYSGLTLSFYDGKYPTYDIFGDFIGVPMLHDNWNNLVYQSGEWAYAFITSTTLGQRSCYIWGENDAENYSYYTTFDNDGGAFPTGFDIQLHEHEESATISDIWLFSYEETIQ